MGFLLSFFTLVLLLVATVFYTFANQKDREIQTISSIIQTPLSLSTSSYKELDYAGFVYGK
jgi:hypothetical protein